MESFTGTRMKYAIYYLPERQEQWYETGEMKCGDKWFQFFEMTLYRQ
jgi:hypothetical protein